MLIFSRYSHIVVIFTAILASTCVSPVALADDTFRVLILNSYDESAMPYARVTDVFKTELQRGRTAQVVITEFDLQERGRGDRAQRDIMAQLLLEQYTDNSPDVILAVGPPAVNFWLNYRSGNLTDIPLISAAADFALASLEFRPRDVVIATPFSYVSLVESILGLRPQTDHILMVFGDSRHERDLTAFAKKELAGFEDRVSFEYTNGMSVAELQERLEELGPGSAVFYGVFDTDSNGVVLSNYSGLALVRSVSSAPVFGAFDDQLGRGIVGGSLIRLDQMGYEAAMFAKQIEQGMIVESVWKTVELSAPAYDWRELQTWKLDSSLLPAASTIAFKPPDVWEQYSNWIILAVVVFLSQSLLAGSLWLQRRRLREAQNVSGRLGRKLISAQEDERRLIARELHDDLSQRLASLAIDASFVASRQGCEEANTVLRNLAPGLVGISKDVHDLSYRLHPSLLDDLGLVAALQAEAARFRRRCNADIVEKIGIIPPHINRDAALCVYRIAQEAINNAIKHAQAEVIRVELDSDEQVITLRVSDDGIGLDEASRSAGSGLGLSSMQERAQLVGGVFRIDSQAGEGTIVKLRVPWSETKQ